MKYSDFGLCNTREMFARAMQRHFAIPAFNFYNMETLTAICNAARQTHSPVILAVSESALRYMGDDNLMGMIMAQKFDGKNFALHLDHGHSVDSCRHAINLGFSSVMFDGSTLGADENIEKSRAVAEYAQKYDVGTEGELGILSGFEDENTSAATHDYTNPDDVVKFINATGIDSLAVSIGTSHGAYKRHSDSESLRFDILETIAKLLPDTPLVLHGASSIPGNLVETINEFGGDIRDAHGIPAEQIRRAVEMNICKINVDSDARLAFTAAVRETLAKNPAGFNPRDYLSAAVDKMSDTYVYEIENIMGSNNQMV
jgi:fructose-bisphosphate aldolase class II